MARPAVPDTDDIARESIEEHHIVKWLLSELETMRDGAHLVTLESQVMARDGHAGKAVANQRLGFTIARHGGA